MPGTDILANPLDKPGYRLEVNETFDAGALNTNLWLPYYLPQWSSREQAAARYVLEKNALVLLIEEDQPPWCPEFDEGVVCSSLQTGVFAGPVGSKAGQHRFSDELLVREAQEKQFLYTPTYGYFEARVKAPAYPGNLAALWMIGTEEVPEQSGEIAMFELFGDHITQKSSEVRFGVHPWADETLTDAFYRETYPFDATAFHIYAVEWTPTHIDFYVDNEKRRTVQQSIGYPMQFMLGLYDLPTENRHTGDYPRRFVVDYFRAWQPEDGYGV